MQLVERGELDLDAPIQKYLPDFQPHNPFHKKITLRQLMSHRAGQLREPPVGNYFDPTAAFPIGNGSQPERHHARLCAPESHTKYSNAGVATVGYVLEKHSGQPFAGYLQLPSLSPWGFATARSGPNRS